MSPHSGLQTRERRLLPDGENYSDCATLKTASARLPPNLLGNSPGLGIVPEGVRTNLPRDAGAARRFLHGPPDDLVGHRCFHTPMAGGTWKEIEHRLLPTPVLAQSFEQFRTERNVAVACAFTLSDRDHHAFAVDVGHLQQ